MTSKYSEFYGRIEQSIDYGDQITTYIADDGRVGIEFGDKEAGTQHWMTIILSKSEAKKMGEKLVEYAREE